MNMKVKMFSECVDALACSSRLRRGVVIYCYNGIGRSTMVAHFVNCNNIGEVNIDNNKS